MITQETSREVETGGVMETGQFSILASGKAFKVLIDGLYSNKIRAVIRELCSNAFDGQVEAGRDYLPFQVHLPTRFDPTFKVRDFGVSLSHANVMGLYTTVFQSTKTGTNAQVGKLGLGSKSPFAYTDQFQVVARLGGEKRTYSAFLGSDGVPSIALFSTDKTFEDDGLEVSFPVAAKDVEAFSTNAREVLQWFPVKPKLTGAPLIFNDTPAMVEGAGWKLYAGGGYRNTTVATAIQGVVGYPLDHNAIPDITAVEKSILQSQIHIDFPIGSLEIAASREGLSYDNPTVLSIKARLAEIAREITVKYTAEIAQQSTFWDACRVFTAILTSSALPTMIKDALTQGASWQGKQLVTNFQMGTVARNIGNDHPLYGWDVHYLGKKHLDRVHLRTDKRTANLYNVYVHTSAATKFYVVNGIVTKEMQKIALHYKDQSDRTTSIILIRAPDDVAAGILAQFGNPPFTKVNDLPEIVRQRSESSSIRRPTVKVTKEQIKVRPMTLYKGDVAKLLEVRDLDAGGYYLAVTDGHYGINTRSYGSVNTKADSYGHNLIWNSLMVAKKIGCFPAIDTVFLVTAPHLKRVEASDKWINLIDAVDALAKAKHADWLTAADLYNKRETLQSFHLSEMYESSVTPAWSHSPIHAMKRMGTEIKSSSTLQTMEQYSINALGIFSAEQKDFTEKFNKIMKGSVPCQSLTLLNEQIEADYPMLRLLSNHRLKEHTDVITAYINTCDEMRVLKFEQEQRIAA